MKVSIIAWRLFWEAFDKQDSTSIDRWLERWVFADDGVTLSMRPQPRRNLRILQASDMVKDSAENHSSCFDKHVLTAVEGLSMNGKIIKDFNAPLFGLSQSKGERKVFSRQS